MWFSFTRAGRLLALIALLLAPRLLAAQQPEGVKLGLLYQPEYQPGFVVLPFSQAGGVDRAAGLVHDIIRQDLDYSDRFQIRDASGAVAGQPVNIALWKQRGADWVLDGALGPRPGGLNLHVILHDAVYGQKKADRVFQLPSAGDPRFRMAVHAVSDEVTRWATGDPGMAASRIAFTLEGRGSKEIYYVDSDGESVQRVTNDGSLALSPAWSPDGGKIAYTSYRSGQPLLYERDLRTGRDRLVSDRSGLNITPAYSPDGHLLAFATTVGENTEVATKDVSRNCCLEQQTRGRNSDSLSPVFSPDGRRLAFVSNRLGQPQIYVMPLGGPATLVSDYEYGKNGYNTAPDWSPTGNQLVYGSRIGGVHQLMLLDLDKSSRRLLTNQDSNEDPSWAPDGRHIVFASSDREGGGLFVLDTVSGRIRPLLRGGGYGLPDWSGTLASVVPGTAPGQ